jgi:RimJ/RimL family protein N-acetyltransferase
MLKGERVTLRAVERDDLPAIHAVRNDPEVEGRVFAAPLPHSLAELEAQFDAQAAKPAHEREDIVFAIETGGAVIGRLILFDQDTVSGTIRLGVGIARDHQGRGLGTEAVDLSLSYAFRDLGVRKVWLDVLADNPQAIASYRKSGFVEEGRMRAHYRHDGEHRDAVLMGILRDEWEARPGVG